MPMTKRARARLAGLLVVVFGLGLAAGLGLYALRDTVSFFYAPSDIHSGRLSAEALARPFRVGGLVKEGSIERTGKTLTFTLTDLASDVQVQYAGVVPDLFREGQGAVAHGHFDGTRNLFMAQQILARHDENYMPPEVKRALDKAGQKAPAP